MPSNAMLGNAMPATAATPSRVSHANIDDQRHYTDDKQIFQSQHISLGPLRRLISDRGGATEHNVLGLGKTLHGQKLICSGAKALLSLGAGQDGNKSRPRFPPFFWR